MWRLILNDIFKGTRTNAYFNFYSKIICENKRFIEEYQFSKFQKLINHAYCHVPYYTNIFNKLKITPSSFTKIQDIKHLPVLTRADIQEHNQGLISRDFTERNKKYFRSSSSGTTGTPISYLHDRDGESSGNAAIYVLWQLSGWNFNNRGIHIWGNPDSISHWDKPASRAKRYIFQQKNIAAFLLNDTKNLYEITKNLLVFKPDYIDGYPGSIYSLAEYLLEKNIKFPKCRYVFTTAENLPDYQRTIIEKAIGPVFDYYGCGEINSIASQIAGNSRYYIFDPHVYVETEENDAANELKEIIVTDLDNLIMPFIRYKTGDLIDGVFTGESDSFPYKYFNKVCGRVSDIIDIGNGKKILPLTLIGGTFIREFKNITRHKVIWDQKKLHFIFECSGEIQKEAINEKLSSMLAHYPVPYSFGFTDKILPDKNGKYRYFEALDPTGSTE
ncbi:MAG: hypothetical protein V1904_04380 [Bacteroidota bacterium]